MRIRFWGVRGSLPMPETPGQIRSKISAVLERLTAKDLESPESRERFLAALPPWLFGVVGGNTSCISLYPGNSEDPIIFDAGSGIRELGNVISRGKRKPSRYHLFFSHYHWDHLQGLPFFYPAYNPAVTVDFYSPLEGLEDALRGQMKPPYFPVGLEAMGCGKKFHQLDSPLELLGLKISFKKMNHPGGSYSYLVEEGRRRFIYATDTELSDTDFIKNEENTSFFKDADLVVIDAQYTLEEAIDKYSWGHSAFSMAVDFAANWGIRHLVFFHHDPAYDDHKLFNILESARGYMEKINVRDLRITLAVEGLEIVL